MNEPKKIKFLHRLQSKVSEHQKLTNLISPNKL